MAIVIPVSYDGHMATIEDLRKRVAHDRELEEDARACWADYRRTHHLPLGCPGGPGPDETYLEFCGRPRVLRLLKAWAVELEAPSPASAQLVAVPNGS